MLCCTCVRTGSVGIIERLGKYHKKAHEGVTVYCWPFDSLATTLSLRVQQLDVPVETKTKDDVFVQVIVSVQYRVNESKSELAHYKLANSPQQIRAYVFDVVRATVPTLELDAAFLSKEDIAVAIKTQLQEAMDDFGFEIKQALVVDLAPDAKVRAAMNEINANRRIRMAAQYRAEAEKISIVKAAEANAESRYLSGTGVANQRKAIVAGLKDSVSEFSENIKGTTSHDVMCLLLQTQYFDMLNAIGSTGRARAIFIPHETVEMQK